MNTENDPVVDSNGNTLKDYLLSGELPPTKFPCELHIVQSGNGGFSKINADKKAQAYFHELWSWVFDDNGSGAEATEEKHKELENKYGKGSRELARQYAMDRY